MSGVEVNISNDEKRDFNDALNNFYKLKASYESSFEKEKHDLIMNKNLSFKEKKKEFKNYKAKCINCKRPVGTLFSRKYNNEFNNVLKCICGDFQNPCNLNITLDIGFFETIPNVIKVDEKDINLLKLDLIKDKNNLLFEYITTDNALKNFDLIKKEIISISSTLEIAQELWLNITNNTFKKKELKKKQEECYIIVDNIKKILNDYNENNNIILVNDVVNIYVKQLVPKLKEIMLLRYSVNQVEYIEEENVYKLIQLENSIQSIEYDYGEPKIISYNIGFTPPK
jgi:hypothetical protein